MDIEHPMITEMERTGYPSHEYLEWEHDQEDVEE